MKECRYRFAPTLEFSEQNSKMGVDTTIFGTNTTSRRSTPACSNAPPRKANLVSRNGISSILKSRLTSHTGFTWMEMTHTVCPDTVGKNPRNCEKRQFFLGQYFYDTVVCRLAEQLPERNSCFTISIH